MDGTELTRAEPVWSAGEEVLTEEQIAGMGREPLLRHLECAKQALQELTELYNEYGQLRNTMSAIIAKRDALEAGKKPKGWVSGIVGFLGFAIAFASFGNKPYKFSETLLGAVMLALGVWYYRRCRKKYMDGAGERKEQSIAYFNEAFAPVSQRLEQVEQQVKELTGSVRYQNALVLIPQDYLDVNAISDVIRILQNRRANGITDALNVYENDLHQRRMEYAANRGADAQERTASAAQVTAAASVRAANAAQASAAANARAANAAQAQAAYAKQISQNTKSAARSAQELSAFVKHLK